MGMYSYHHITIITNVIIMIISINITKDLGIKNFYVIFSKLNIFLCKKTLFFLWLGEELESIMGRLIAIQYNILGLNLYFVSQCECKDSMLCLTAVM